MKKYLTIFKIGWQSEMEYRLNLLLGRLRVITTFLLLYYIWHSLASASGRFAGYTWPELITYVFGVTILRSVLFGAQSRMVAQEISSGSFSVYLVRPVNHFLFTFWRELSQRSLYLLITIAEVSVFACILKVSFIWQSDWKLLFSFLISCTLAFVLYFLLSYAMSLIAFWSNESTGPRFLFDWFLEFASGAYFPLAILGAALLGVFKALPFMYLIFLPISIYLGKTSSHDIIVGLCVQLLWIGIMGLMVLLLWHRGMRRYSGEGM